MTNPEGAETAQNPRPLITNAMLAYTTQPADDWTSPPTLAAPYVYGGWRPDVPTVGDSGPGWDCSGCFGYVLAHQLEVRDLPDVPADWYAQMPYHPGPVSQYVAWDQLWTVPQGDVPNIVSGDVLIWSGANNVGHMGVAISETMMVSALSEQYGTFVSPFSSGWVPSGVPLLVRRMLWSSYKKLVEI